jgi:hypothetical protein
MPKRRKSFGYGDNPGLERGEDDPGLKVERQQRSTFDVQLLTPMIRGKIRRRA